MEACAADTVEAESVRGVEPEFYQLERVVEEVRADQTQGVFDAGCSRKRRGQERCEIEIGLMGGMEDTALSAGASLEGFADCA